MSELGIVLPAPKGGLQDIGSKARLAEEHGFSGVYGTEATIDGLSTALQAALATERVTIGTAIANIYYRHPALAGMTASHIQEVSGGRMALGLGTSHQVINAPRGIDMSRPLTAMRGYLEEVKSHFWGEPPPKLFLGALRLGMTRLAGEATDGVILNMIPLSRLPASVAAFHEGVAKRTDGVTPKVALFIGASVSNDLDAAREEARKGVAMYFRMEFYRNLMSECGYGAQAEAAGKAWEARDGDAAHAAVTDDLVDELFLYGPAERCRARLEEFRTAGVDLPIISPRGDFSDGTPAFEAVLQGLAPR